MSNNILKPYYFHIVKKTCNIIIMQSLHDQSRSRSADLDRWSRFILFYRVTFWIDGSRRQHHEYQNFSDFFLTLDCSCNGFFGDHGSLLYDMMKNEEFRHRVLEGNNEKQISHAKSHVNGAASRGLQLTQFIVLLTEPVNLV